MFLIGPESNEMETKYHSLPNCIRNSIVLLLFLILIAPGCTNHSTAKNRSTLKKVSIDETLGRTDLPDDVRKKFETIKKSGRKEILQREIDEAIRISQTVILEPVMMEVASKFARRPIPQPSLSELEEIPLNKYPRKPVSALEFHQGKADYLRIGVDHFLKKDIPNLNSENRKSIAKFMNSVLDGPETEFNEQVWAKIGNEGAGLSERFWKQLREEPMFLMCLAIAESKDNKAAAANRRLDTAITLFRKNDYPTRMAMHAFWLQNNIRSEYHSRTHYHFRVAAIKHWLTKDFRARGVDERYAMRDIDLFFQLAFLNKDFPALEEFTDILLTEESLPPWFRAMALAKYHHDLGFHYRGNGFANTVTKEGWKKLEEQAGFSHDYYEAAIEANPLFPEAAVGLMGISQLGYSKKDEEFWFNKAIEHEVDFMQAYRSRLWTLTPRWGGSVNAMLDFAREHAAKKNYETSVPFILPHCIFFLRDADVVNDIDFDRITANRKLLDEIIAALHGLSEHNKDYFFRGNVYDKKYLQTLEAQFLSRAGYAAKSKRLFQELKGRPSPAAMKLYGKSAAGSSEAMTAQVSAFSSEHSEEARKLQNLMADPVENRIANFKKIEELIGDISLPDDDGGLYFKRALDTVRQEKAFNDGKSVKLGFDPKLNMWRQQDLRHLEYISESSATYDNREGDKFNRVIYGAIFPGPKVTEVTLSFPRDAKPNPAFAPAFTIGVLEKMVYSIGASISEEKAYQPAGTKRGPAGDVRVGTIHFGLSTGLAPPFKYPFPLKDNKCNLRVYTDNNWIEVYTDDQFLFRHHTPQSVKLSPVFALQVNRGTKGTGDVEVSDIKVQKWSGAPPVKFDAAAYLKHYQKVYDLDPKDKWNQFWLAHAKHAKGDHDGAMELYKKACDSGVNKQIAGFYIGDILDKQGKRKEAFDWYLESALGFSDGGPSKVMYADLPSSRGSKALNWSSFRASWLSEICGFEVEKKEYQYALSSRAQLTKKLKWLEQCRKMLPRKNSDDNFIESKIKTLGYQVKKTPEQYKYIPENIISEIRKNRIFKMDPAKEPLYLKVKESTPFFRHIDD